jgi:hypothetical protein
MHYPSAVGEGTKDFSAAGQPEDRTSCQRGADRRFFRFSRRQELKRQDRDGEACEEEPGTPEFIFLFYFYLYLFLGEQALSLAAPRLCLSFIFIAVLCYMRRQDRSSCRQA